MIGSVLFRAGFISKHFLISHGLASAGRGPSGTPKSANGSPFGGSVIQGIGKTWASTKICRLSNVRPVQLEQPRIGAIKGLQGSQCSSYVRSGTYGDPGKTGTATDKIGVRPRLLTSDRRWALMEFADWTQPAVGSRAAYIS